jgi:tetratricopeptide (TPR) repeat protein
MDRAEAAYASRPDEAAVEEAVNLWLEAAVVDATDADPIMGAVRAQTWLAEYASDPARRRSVAAESVDTAQWCRRRERANSACSYYLALAVGVQANQVRSTATDGLEIIVRALNNTIADAETIDHAGPHRVLALVLVRAPGWPIGPGDPDLALVHAERAVELFPAYGPNWLALAEARQETDQATAALAAYQCALEAARATSRDPDAAIWIAEAQAALAGTAGAACTER